MIAEHGQYITKIEHNKLTSWNWMVAHPKNLNLGAKSFRFLHISSCFPRKGIQVLLEAYGEAFTINDDVSLIIKTFRNPHNNYAAKLIEDCNLKGYTIGGAQISKKHANFIINLGNASAIDIEKLIEYVRERVFDLKKIMLETEIKFIGDNYAPK